MTVYIIATEPIGTRYTLDWYKYVPSMVEKNTGIAVQQISGRPITNEPTTGAFLDFAATNIWKNDQASQIAEMFSKSKIKDGSYFLFMDAWNPIAIEVRYMADLFGVEVKIGALWHAGAYDPYDFLGRKIKNKKWSTAFETSLFHLYDHNFFATQYHIDLFTEVLGIGDEYSHKIIQTGWPMEYSNIARDNQLALKENLIVFPHRISEEKQPELFRSLAKLMPEYEFIVCQDTKLTKKEYHNILRRAKIVFSANLQETLGIGVVEGMMAGAVPLVPDRLSYQEMYFRCFKYSAEEEKDLTSVAARIRHIMNDWIVHYDLSQVNLKRIQETFFTGTELYSTIKGSING